jgi:hypothetical protein
VPTCADGGFTFFFPEPAGNRDDLIWKKRAKRHRPCHLAQPVPSFFQLFAILAQLAQKIAQNGHIITLNVQ